MLKFMKENKWAVASAICVLALGAPLFLPKVSLERRLLKSGKKHMTSRENSLAVDDFERAVHYAPEATVGLEAARLGGELCLFETHDYRKAVFFFKHIV